MTIFAIAIVAFNFASGVAWPLALGGSTGFLRLLSAYWFTMVAASLFLYASVLTLQGMTALLLPRRVFLKVSALIQIGAFGVFLGMYFLQPAINTPAALTAAHNHRMLAAFPSFWFFALLNQLNGSLPPALGWLARRAWIALATATVGATASLLLCYLRTMRKTIEEPDLVPGAGGLLSGLRFGSALDTAVLFFTLRTVIRSRQHRLAVAFYFAVVFALTVLLLRPMSHVGPHSPISVEFLSATLLMIGFSVVGLRKVFNLPIWLGANWVFRITQLQTIREYMIATRRSLLVLGVLPVWCITALISLRFRPLSQVAVHLMVLGLFGIIVCDIGLVGFQKLPFTCSYLPGKANVQFMFWGMVIVVLPLLVLGAVIELHALDNLGQCVLMMGVLMAVSIGFWAVNRYRAKSLAIYFEETMPEAVISLGLTAVQRSESNIELHSRPLGETTSGCTRN